MSNPTSNFGWQMPTPTDLVTDLPADFEVFGQAVDSSLADLKGGTTGQVLSKNSNTDMDFVWVTDAAGDITGVTAGTGITGGGTSGSVTVSFDQTNFGGGQFAAGKNKIINGAFNVWQRGTSFNTTGLFFGPDRFKTFSYSGSSATISQQTFTPGTAPVAGYESQYFCRVSSTNTQNLLLQNIEDARTFAGQTITVSFWAKSATATSVSVGFEQNFGSGGSTSVFASMGSVSVTTSWARYSVSYAIPSISGKTVGTSSYLQIYFASTTLNNNLDFWGIQAEVGSTATPFQTATGTIQGELAACQRYYERMTSQSSNARFGAGIASGLTAFNPTMYFAVTKRIAASTIDYANLTTYDSTIRSFTTITYSEGSLNSTTINVTGVTSGLTTGRTTELIASTTGGYIGFSAEL
jgi:hypothetical protein